MIFRSEIFDSPLVGGSYDKRAQLRQLNERSSLARGERFIALAAIVLAMFAIFGKPFAYTFLADLLLVYGVFVLMNSKGRSAIRYQPIFAVLVLFMVWGAARTYPFLRRYRIDAVRDAAVWGYGLWAFVLAGLLCASPKRLPWLLGKYPKFAWVFLVCIGPLFFLSRSFGGTLPQMPLGDSPIIHVKAGDALVHVAGVLAFTILFHDTRKLWLKLALIGCCSVLFAVNRGGVVAMMATVFVAFVARPGSRVVWTWIGAVLFAIAALWVTGIEIRLPGSNRGVSFFNIQEMIGSILVGSENNTGGMDATREWRLNWWKDIIHYTLQGKYFWTGKGFGINLADSDGYQVGGALRSPHNGHMMILARMGVPGAALWILLQGMWFTKMFDAFFRARVLDDRRWRATFAFLIAYYVGLMTNTTFDVFLEGPMGGVWIWSIFGIGVAAIWIYGNCPEAMYPEDEMRPSAVARKPLDIDPTLNRMGYRYSPAPFPM